MNNFDKLYNQILEQAPSKAEIGKALQGAIASIGDGAKDAAIKRAAMMSSQGRTSEARGLIGQYVKDPEKLKKVFIAMDERLKPIPGATSSNLDKNKEYNEWLDSVWVPWVKKYI